MKLLVLSNGAGEDAIAASILAHLLRLRPELEIEVFPLLGAGAAYPVDLPRWGDGSAPPSLGLSNQSWRLWWHDLRHGLLGRVLSQWRLLRQHRGQVGACLAVGDLVPCLLAGLAGMAPVYFVGTAKSVYHHAYSWPERWLLRRLVSHSLVRDQATAEDMRSHRLPADWLGNAMMDDTVPAGLELGLAGDVLAIFPGSRAQAPSEMPRLLRIWQSLRQRHACGAAVAVAEGMPLEDLAPAGWQLESRECGRGWVGTLHHSEAPPVPLVRGALGDLLAHSQVALGQAGTAHEQAAGAGLPVVSLHENPQGRLGWYRGRQKGLLGEALLVVREEEAVTTLLGLFQDRAERERRAAIGRQRMGPPGGAARIAGWLAERL